MNTKIIIAVSVAALSLATTAFAAEGGSGAFAPDVGSAQYPAYNAGLATAPLGMPTLPTSGQEGTVQTANSLPVGAMVGTSAYARGAGFDRWFAQQDAHRFAELQHRPSGS